MICKRLKKYTKTSLPRKQFGFREGNPTEQAMLTVKMLVKKANDLSQQLFLFYDVLK